MTASESEKSYRISVFEGSEGLEGLEWQCIFHCTKFLMQKQLIFHWRLVSSSWSGQQKR